MKLVYQYIVIFFTFPSTANHLHPLQVENCGSNSRLVVDEVDNVNSGLKEVRHCLRTLSLLETACIISSSNHGCDRCLILITLTGASEFRTLSQILWYLTNHSSSIVHLCEAWIIYFFLVTSDNYDTLHELKIRWMIPASLHLLTYISYPVCLWYLII